LEPDVAGIVTQRKVERDFTEVTRFDVLEFDDWLVEVLGVGSEFATTSSTSEV
jgi:hypothetical protein